MLRAIRRTRGICPGDCSVVAGSMWLGGEGARLIQPNHPPPPKIEQPPRPNVRPVPQQTLCVPSPEGKMYNEGVGDVNVRGRDCLNDHRDASACVSRS